MYLKNQFILKGLHFWAVFKFINRLVTDDRVYIFAPLFIYLFFWAWRQALRDKEPCTLNDSKAKAD